MEHILIIDDDKELCTLMKKCVEKEGWFAMVAHNGLEGLKFLDEYREGCVLIILDVMMPGIDGFQVLQKIRESSNVPVLMLTAKGDEGDKVFGLRLGADDYLTKPFSISELMARVNSLVRRYTTLNQQESHNQDKIVLKGMSINKSNREVIVQNNQIELTGKEFDLLLFLAMNKGKVYTKRQIYLQVWSDEYAFDDSIYWKYVY